MDQETGSGGAVAVQIPFFHENYVVDIRSDLTKGRPLLITDLPDRGIASACPTFVSEQP